MYSLDSSDDEADWSKYVPGTIGKRVIMQYGIKL